MNPPLKCRLEVETRPARPHNGYMILKAATRPGGGVSSQDF